MTDYIWIVIIKGTNIIESIWSTEALAKAAISLYAHNAQLPIEHYDYIPRVLNTTYKPK